MRKGLYGIFKYGFKIRKDLQEYQKFTQNLRANREKDTKMKELEAEAKKWENTFQEFMKDNQELIDKVAIIAAKNRIDSMIKEK